ncbi:DSHCT domain protein, partial [Opisthorchis viverrini]
IEVELRRTKDVLDKKNAIFHELKERKRFLRQLGFCSETDELTFKGRVACEISSGDELILTELLLDNFFSPLTPVQLAGVMSCFVAKKPVGKHQHTQLRPDMAQALETIKAKARSLARVAIECGICYSRGSSDPINEKSDDIAKLAAQLNNWMRLVADEQACVDQFSGHLMEVVRAWAEGVCFARLREFAPLSDGIIIRCLRKLSGLLRQMHNAAKVAGRTELGNKFLE